MVDGGAEGAADERWPAGHPVWKLVVDDDVYGWLLIDGDGVISYYNEGVAALLGRPHGGAVGTSMFDHVHPDDVAIALEAMAELAGPENEMELVGLPMVFRAIHADGSVVPVEVGAAAYLDIAGVEAVRLRVRAYGRDETLHDYLEALASGAAPRHLFQAAVRLADATLTGGTTAILHDWDGKHYRTWVTDRLPAGLLAAVEDADGDGLPWLQCRDGEPHIVAVADLDGPLASAAADAGYQSVWAEPLTIGDDEQPSAALVIFRPWSQPPLVGHMAAARRLRSTIALAFLAQRARDRMVLAASSDSLTGLANRSKAFALLESGVAEGPTAVLYVDLDGFKAVNDSRGHGAGDVVLEEVARALAAAAAPATAARIGGDEFLVIVADAPPLPDLAEMADDLLAALCRSVPVDGGTLEVRATIGVARYPEHGTTPDDLVEAADRALYRAKRAGGAGWAIAYGDGS
jgi:diguanylate cyclase (GGDEF)-like protein/PAS domain S-box-containing protein